MTFKILTLFDSSLFKLPSSNKIAPKTFFFIVINIFENIK